MDDTKKEINVTSKECEVIDDDNMKQVTGGGMRDNIVITETTPISEDTKEKI